MFCALLGQDIRLAYRTIGPLVSSLKHISNLNALHLWYNFQPKKECVVFFIVSYMYNIQIMW